MLIDYKIILIIINVIISSFLKIIGLKCWPLRHEKFRKDVCKSEPFDLSWRTCNRQTDLKMNVVAKQRMPDCMVLK